MIAGTWTESVSLAAGCGVLRITYVHICGTGVTGSRVRLGTKTNVPSDPTTVVGGAPVPCTRALKLRRTLTRASPVFRTEADGRAAGS